MSLLALRGGFDFAACVVLELRVGTEILLANPERNSDEPNQYRHFYEWADDGGEGGSVADAEDADGDRDREFEVIARGGE